MQVQNEIKVEMSPIDFWHQHIGHHFGADLSPHDSVHPFPPTRMSKGVAPLRLGAGISAGYIASPEGSYLIGKVDMPDAPGLKFVRGEDASVERTIAQWLVHSASEKEQWMIGIIGKANAQGSMRISSPPGLCYYCENNSGFAFNLDKVKAGVAAVGTLDWKSAVATGLHALRKRDEKAGYENKAALTEANQKLIKLFDKHVCLREALLKLKALGIQPGTGEYQVLSWYHRER